MGTRSIYNDWNHIRAMQVFKMFLGAVGAVFLLAAVSGNSLDVCLQDLGCLKGTEMPGFQTDSFEAFLGIPFAQPPVGELRFKVLPSR